MASSIGAKGSAPEFSRVAPGLAHSLTQRANCALLASAEVDCFRLRSLEFHGREPAALMAAITERLVGAFPAGAPEVTLTRLDCHRIRCFLSNIRLGHQWVSQVKK